MARGFSSARGEETVSGTVYYWSKNGSVATTMGRPLRVAPGELIYHVLNRVNGRQRLFDDDGDYRAFERVRTQACDRVSMRLLAYCVMPNHWHLVVWPRQDGDLSRFMNWLTLTIRNGGIPIGKRWKQAISIKAGSNRS
jgi:hypothetical protein